MAFELESFQDPDLDADYVEHLADRLCLDSSARYQRLWDYFRNPLMPAIGPAAGALNAHSRPYFQAQEIGLPARITGVQRLEGRAEHLTDLTRKEVVIENDIAWRVHTMIDFLFPKPITIRSLAKSTETARSIERIFSELLDANGGMSFLQQTALFGSVYGFADIALRAPADGLAERLPALPRPASLPSARVATAQTARRPGTPEDNPAGNGGKNDADGASASGEGGPKDPTGDRSKTLTDRAVTAARMLQLETVEAPRILPILAEDDYTRVKYWVQKYHKHPARLDGSPRRWLGLGRLRSRSAATAVVEVIEILGADWWQRYENRQLVAEGPNALGRVPVVHIQNIALPGSYAGLSDVEPLIPLQDELNTRLSDRAHRVTYQSFKMYLGKGIDDFLERPVGPGQMWATHNLDASIQEFGADSVCPSEDAHIDQVRQAMDKVSGVTPLAAGLIRGNVGNLTSATALKVLLGGMLAKTARKRLTYAAGLQQLCELLLDWLDASGVLSTRPEDRRIEVHWPNPLPADEGEQLRNAQIKAQLGVDPDSILAELGYDRK